MNGTADLAGRGSEIDQLDAMVSALTAGRGGMVWVEGEPGIGKSALLRAVRARARGCQTYLAVGDEFTRRLPLRALLDCLDPRLEHDLVAGAYGADGLPPGDPVPAMVERLSALVDRMTAARPVLLAFDDLQWADEASLLVVRRLGRATAQMPLLLVVASGPVPANGSLVRLRRLAAAEGAVVVTLGRLSADAVDSLVARLAGARPGPALRRLAGQCGGNPLYLREVVDALVRERLLRVGAGVAELVDEVDPGACSWTRALAARLDFLSAPTNRAVRVAALLGTPFSLSDLAVVAALPATTLVPLMDEAIAAGVLCENGDRLAFRHALIRQALYRTTPAAARAAIHGQAARALVRSAAPVQQVATHLLGALETLDDWALDWLVEHAAELAYRVPEVAVDLLGPAAQRCAGDPRQDPLRYGLANALLLLRRLDEAERIAGQALAGTADPHRVAELISIIAFARSRANRDAEAVQVLEEALLRTDLPPVWRLRLRGLRAYVLSALGRTAEAADEGRAVLSAMERVPDRTAVAYALLTGYACADHHDGLRYLDRILAEIGDDPRYADLRLSMLLDRAVTLDTLGAGDGCDRALSEALVLAEQRVAWRLGSVRVAAGWCYAQRGRWEDAWTELYPTQEYLTLLDQVVRLGTLAFLAVHRDDRAATASILPAADALPPLTGHLYGAASHLWMARAVRAEQRADVAGAVDALAGTVDIDDGQSLYDRYLWLPELVRLALARSDHDLARAAVAAAEADAARDPVPRRACTAHRARAILDGDADALLHAVVGWPALGPLDRGQTYEQAAVLLAETGETVRARAALTEAVRCYLDLGAAWDIRRADARLRGYGIRRGPRAIRRRPATGWEALTPTEHRVTELVAQGRSNPDIATEMFLSRRTVQMHVSNILAKLGYSSRIDIAREAGRRADP